MDRPHLGGPFARRDTSFRSLNRGWHDVFTVLRSFAQGGQSFCDKIAVTLCAPGVQTRDLFLFNGRIDNHNAAVTGHKGARLALLPFVDAHDDGFARFDAVQARGVGFNQTAFHIVD